MKRILLFLLLLPASQFALAQEATVSGTVKDSQGDPLHFAFVQEQQTKHGVYTDSLGDFSIQVTPNANIRVNCAGYKDTVFTAGNQTNLMVILKVNGVTNTTASNINQDANKQTMQRTFNDAITLSSGRFNSSGGFDAGQGAAMPTFNPKEETVGSRYLFKGWVHGYVVTVKDSTVQNPGFLFDYDKIGGGLLLTKDRQSAIEINKELVKSFTLSDNQNNSYTFERVPQIDETHYVQLISAGNKYKVYKTIKTKLITANYTTDGVMTTGNNYDEYVDENDYYVYNEQTKALQKIDLKKKSIKTVFASEPAKLNKYMSDHSGDSIDDMYLSGLGSYMNE